VQPVVRAAAAVAALAALVRVAEWLSPEESPQETRPVASPSARAHPCPPGTLPDGRACIPVGMGVTRGPGARRDFAAYELPVPSALEAFVGRSDLGPSERTGPDLADPVGIDLAAERGAEVRMVRLLGQVGDAEVVATGQIQGLTVVTLHETGRDSGSYLVVHGRLGATAPGLERGTKVRDGARIGSIGDPGGPGLCYLYFEVRRVREGVDARHEPVEKLLGDASSLVTDPRNVLSLRGAAGATH
jgi:hypothetical protein